MALLKIVQKRAKFSMRIPHKICINRQLLGIMQTPEVQIQMPAGHYELTIQSMIPFISASRMIHVQEGVVNYAEFHDREKWWDYLFVVDIILWLADFSLPCRIHGGWCIRSSPMVTSRYGCFMNT